MTLPAVGNRPHDNLQAQAIGMIFAFPAVATVAVLLRVYIRVWTRSFAADDWVICGAGILYWAETVTSYYVIKYNYVGYHIWDVPQPFNSTPGAKFSYATELLYNPILALIKTSILLFLLRLTGQKLAVRRTILFLLTLNAIAALATFLITTFNCLPVASNWNPSAYPNKKCINFADFVTATASVSIFTDFLVLLMPTWIVYNLHIARRQKIMLVGILSFGLVTVLAGIIRVILLDNFDRHIPDDSTYSVLFCLSTIEVGLAFVAACAPALKPLFMRLVPKLFSASSRGGQYHARAGTSSRRAYGYAYGGGYNLDPMGRSRRTQDGNVTSVEAGEWTERGRSRSRSRSRKGGRGGGGKGGIFMTTETEVKWHDQDHDAEQGHQHSQHSSIGRPVDDGSSMESLVRAGR
ncbi:hypothetical protein BDW74DRAFT_182450 [Aspergillus multicolor]|uniref:uncharacterized protein n=1 Tax=Aspergillus multicolor TaxID=41759 RepID=UPI003CCCFB0F